MHWAVIAMYVGLALTVVATVVPFIDRDVLADHIRAGYPGYRDERVNSATTAYLIYLTVVGALGVAGWLSTIRITKRWGRGAPIVTTVMFLLGSGVALTNLFVNESSGERALPASLGVVGVVPAVAGLVAVALVWKASASVTHGGDESTPRAGPMGRTPERSLDRLGQSHA